MNIRLRQLRAFKAIVETGSVSAASVSLGLTQSSVSKLLAGFEEELGFQLFERIGRRLRLSEQGRLFLDRASTAIDLLEDIQSEAIDIRDNQGKRLRLCAVGPLIHSHVIPQALASFAQKHPDFAFSIEMKKRIEIEEWIIQRHSDIGFTLFPIDPTQLNARTLANVHPVVAMRRDHPLAGRAVIEPKDLRDVDLIMPKGSVRLRGVLEADFVQANVHLRPRFETSNAITTVHLIAHGNGVAIIDPFSISGSPNPDLKILKWAPETVLSYGMIWPNFRNLTHFEEDFFQAAKDVILRPDQNHRDALFGSRPIET